MVEIKVTGIPRVSATLLKKNVAIKAEVGRTMNTTGLFLAGEVKQSVAGHKAEDRSVDTGRFLNSITHTSSINKAVISSNVGYAARLEFGKGTPVKSEGIGKRLRKSVNEKISPLPPGGRRHFRNSLARNKSKIIKFIKGAVSRATKL